MASRAASGKKPQSSPHPVPPVASLDRCFNGLVLDGVQSMQVRAAKARLKYCLFADLPVYLCVQARCR